MTEIKLKCSSCKEEKPTTSFSTKITKKRGYRYNCRKCEAEQQAAYRAKVGPEKLKASRKRAVLKGKYNLSIEDFNTLLEQQNNLCAICKKPDVIFKNLSVDHNHKTGKVRGLLCSAHNRALGLFGDNLQLLKSAVQYMEEKDG